MNIVNTHVHCFILDAWHESCFPSSGIHSNLYVVEEKYDMYYRDRFVIIYHIHIPST